MRRRRIARGVRRRKNSHPPALARPAAVMGDRGDVADGGNGEPRGLQCPQGRFPARPGPRHLDLEGAHAVFHRLLGGILGRDLGRERRRLARALESLGPGRGPGDRIALGVGDGDHRVVERRIHVRDARGDVLALTPPNAGSGFLAHRASILSRLGRDNPRRRPLLRRLVSMLLLLARDRLCRALAGAGVGVGALPAHREAAAVPQAPVGAGIPTLSMTSWALCGPMPWMYWSAITTRLLVGIFTPAIRATIFAPVAGRCRLYSRQMT